MRGFRAFFSGFDIILALGAILLSLLGLVTMYSYLGNNAYFERQVIWISVAIVSMVVASIPDYGFLRTSGVGFLAYLTSIVLLVLVFFIGDITLGAQSRINFGFFSLQPSDPAKLALIIVLAKYFSKRHIEIAHFKHIFISGLYAGLLFVLIFKEPDFGSALIIFGIWLGMVLVSGISLRHLAVVGIIGTLSFGLLWSFALRDYQKERITTFLNPLADRQGAGYNAYQSTIAVGSGQIFGKGVGFGTQSKLQFLPEYETDFIFAAFAEEWGIVGVLVIFILFGVVIWRILLHALRSSFNFERLFCAGVGVLIISHFFVHVGINIGLLPVTGTTIPFLSYGGSHLVTEFICLGIIMGMRKNHRSVKLTLSEGGLHGAPVLLQ
jgi:rod shape determining protein RodA